MGKDLANAGLNGILVIGAARFPDRMVVHPKLKGDLVDHLRRAHRKTVWAFGGSPVDLPLLERANHAIVVVGEEASLSGAMGGHVDRAVCERGLKARQILLPATAKPYLDVALVRGVAPIQDDIFNMRSGLFRYCHLTDYPATRLLTTPMRSRSVSGPALSEAHHQAGRYLALNLVIPAIGIESIDIHDVHGSLTSGWQLRNEPRTMIVAKMRAGEPLAKGIHDFFPRASFGFIKAKKDILSSQLKDYDIVILVDGIVNSGRTMMHSIEWIHQAQPQLQIVVVAAFVQSNFFTSRYLTDTLSRVKKDMHFIYLHSSDHHQACKGTADTGNRLFNTTNKA